MPLPLRTGALASLALAACTIRVEQPPASDENGEAECLELFQTCVELAGESPGCNEVYQFCIGSVMSADTDGAGGAIDGCEQDYVDCLEEGGDPEACQPLLDMCMPDPPTTTTTGGPCAPGDPDCPTTTGSGDGETTSGCTPGDPTCMPIEDCEAGFLECVDRGYDEGACLAVQDECEAGDCESVWNICTDNIVEPSDCENFTGCPNPNPDTCQQILSGCENEGLTISECAAQWPDNPECFPDGVQCDWYTQECESQGFVQWFCEGGLEGCQQGLLPQVFECASFVDDACQATQLTDTACAAANDACANGFDGVSQCTMTQLFDDPYQWLAELAQCNGWE